MLYLYVVCSGNKESIQKGEKKKSKWTGREKSIPV